MFYPDALPYVRTVPPNFQCLVNGEDYSQQLIEARGSYSQYGPQGYLTISGTYKFNVGIEPLEDSAGRSFAIGNDITLKIDTSFAQQGNYEEADVLGKTYIAETYFDEEAGVLEVQTVCLLGSLNTKNPAQLGVCVGFGEESSYLLVISTLLNKAGLNGVSPTVGAPASIYKVYNPPGETWTFPIELGQEDSFISLAGQIAFANGRVLFADKYGKINDLPFGIYPNIASLRAEDCVINRRQPSPQLPPRKLVLTGNNVLYKQMSAQELEEETITEEFTPDGKIETIRYSETDKNTRKITDTLLQEGPYRQIANGLFPTAQGELIYVEEIKVSQYEPKSKTSARLDSDTPKCFPPDEGRLLTIKTERREPKVKAFGAYYSALAAKAQADGSSLPFTYDEVITIITSYIYTEDWVYDVNNPPKPQQISGLPTNVPQGLSPIGNSSAIFSRVKQTQETRQPFGAVYASQLARIAALISEFVDSGGSIDDLPFTGETMAMTRRVVTEWQQRSDTKRWQKIVKIEGLQGAEDPGQLDAVLAFMEADPGNFQAGIGRAYAIMSAFIPISLESESNSGSPPESRWPSTIDEQRWPFKGEANNVITYTGKDIDGKTETYSLGDFSLMSSGALNYFVQDLLDVIVGRSRARQFVMPVSLGTAPLIPHATITMYSGLNSPGGVYVVESPSFALTPTECLRGFTGSCLSESGGGLPTYPYAYEFLGNDGLVELESNCEFQIPLDLAEPQTLKVDLLLPVANAEAGDASENTYSFYAQVTITLPAGPALATDAPWLPDNGAQPIALGLKPVPGERYKLIVYNTIPMPGLMLKIAETNIQLCFDKGDYVSEAIVLPVPPVVPEPLLPRPPAQNTPAFSLVDFWRAEPVRILTDAYTFYLPYHDSDRFSAQAELKAVYDELTIESADGLDFMLYEGTTDEDDALLTSEPWA